MEQFNPASGLSNRHIQTIFSSIGPRKALVNRRFKCLKRIQQEDIINCGGGVRLQAFYNKSDIANSEHNLAVLIHGWEGSHDSIYMKSLCQALVSSGVDVLRLNLRDHGSSHHLNKELFNSSLIEEVVGAIKSIQDEYSPANLYLVGFSLGGNFCIRAASLAPEAGIKLSAVFACCPVIIPHKSNAVILESNNWLYQKYFVRKWLRSMEKKHQHWPGLELAENLQGRTSLDEMNKYFVPRYTPYKTPQEYFETYRLTERVIKKIETPTHVFLAKDDMMIPIEDASVLDINTRIRVSISQYGGHCGYISNWRGDCWFDQQVLKILSKND